MVTTSLSWDPIILVQNNEDVYSVLAALSSQKPSDFLAKEEVPRDHRERKSQGIGCVMPNRNEIPKTLCYLTAQTKDYPS